MAEYGEFEGREVLLAKLNVGAVRFPTAANLNKGDEVIVVIRVQVDEIAFPPGEVEWRLQKGKAVRRRIGKKQTSTIAAMVTDPEQKRQLAQWLSDETEGRDGGQQRLGAGDEGPDWLREEPGSTEQVELGDGPARTKRSKKKGGLAAVPDPDVDQDKLDAEMAELLDGDEAQPPPLERWVQDAARAAQGEPPMSDEEWEASGGRTDTEP